MVNRLKAEIFKSLGHPTRVQILELLQDSERCVCEIFEELEMEQSNVSQHLGILKNQDLVTSRKEGTKVIYGLKYPEIKNMMDMAGCILDRQLDETQETLHRVRGKKD